MEARYASLHWSTNGSPCHNLIDELFLILRYFTNFYFSDHGYGSQNNFWVFQPSFLHGVAVLCGPGAVCLLSRGLRCASVRRPLLPCLFAGRGVGGVSVGHRRHAARHCVWRHCWRHRRLARWFSTLAAVEGERPRSRCGKSAALEGALPLLFYCSRVTFGWHLVAPLPAPSPCFHLAHYSGLYRLAIAMLFSHVTIHGSTCKYPLTYLVAT